VNSEDFFELRHLVQQASRQRTLVTSMCEGKRRYEGKQEADRGIRQGKPIRAYRCLVCHGWHVGSMQTSREHRLVRKRVKEEMCE
jgi:hypothetical protein